MVRAMHQALAPAVARAVLLSVLVASCAPDPASTRATGTHTELAPAQVVQPADEFARMWPEYRAAIQLNHGTNQWVLTLDDARTIARGGVGNDVAFEFNYAVQNAVVDRLRIVEISSLHGEGLARTWTRRFTIAGLASREDVFVRVPLRTPAGDALDIRVNGAALLPEFGATEARVPLARDEATEIALTRF